MLIKTRSGASDLLLEKLDTNSKLLELPKYTRTDDWGIEAFSWFSVNVKAKNKKPMFYLSAK